MLLPEHKYLDGNPNVGETTQQLNTRMKGHRSSLNVEVGEISGNR